MPGTSMPSASSRLRGQRLADAPSVTTPAPRIGPNSVPIPPTTGARMMPIERDDVEHLLGKQVVVIEGDKHAAETEVMADEITTADHLPAEGIDDRP